jgi:hypothetical protein
MAPLFSTIAYAGTFYPYGDGNYGAGIYQGCDGSNCTLTLSTSGTVNVNVVPTVSGVCTVHDDSVLIETNDPDGYAVTFTTTTTNTNMVSGSDNITRSTASESSPAALTMGKWGYRVDGVSGFGSGPASDQDSSSIPGVTFAGVPASNESPDTIASSVTTALSGDTVPVWYGVCADISVPTGTYTVQVIYTAVAN